MSMNKVWVYILLSITSMRLGHAQVVVDTSYSASYLVEKVLLGSGVIVGNVKYTGEKHAISTYLDDSNQLGIKKGILLTSGNAYYALGPNKSPRTGWASSSKGDVELESIARGKTWDAAVLEFDFVTASENLTFRYVFASEEYLEYVGSKFNDVFGFFISRNDEPKVNIAKLPDGQTPITINTVNNALNNEYYVDNAYHNTTDPFIWDVRNKKVIDNENYLQEEIPPKFDTQFDGFTKVLEARYKVVPNQIYHIKLAISDVGDGILDSGVFLEAGSFQSSGDLLVALDDHFEKELPVKKLSRITETNVEQTQLPNTKIPKRHLIGFIEFEFDRSNLTSLAANTVARVYNQWMETSGAIIDLVGHTDDLGSHSYNDLLSMKRSESVAKMLTDLGVPSTEINVNYVGETIPLSSNETEEGRARNRRVEFYLVY